jgi:hypothetical protein
MAEKPMLVGESNPYGADPAFALYPAPDGCSGHRLCGLVLGMSRRDYLDAFERRNLCVGKWRMRVARASAQALRTWPAPLILLGAKVARAFEFDPFEPWTLGDGGKTVILPHPSGLCRLWNEPGAFTRAQLLVVAACPELVGIVGKRA